MFLEGLTAYAYVLFAYSIISLVDRVVMAFLRKTLPMITLLQKTRQSYLSLFSIAPVKEDILTERVLDILLSISKNVSFMAVG